MADFQIVELTEEYIEGFHVVWVPSRDRLYIGLVDSPPIEGTRSFLRSVRDSGGAHFVAPFLGSDPKVRFGV